SKPSGDGLRCGRSQRPPHAVAALGFNCRCRWTTGRRRAWRCGKALTATRRDLGAPTASTPSFGTGAVHPQGEPCRERRPTAQLFWLRAGNRLKLLVFSSRSVAAGRKMGAKNYRRNLKNRLEPFGDLRRLIGEQADKAGITTPIGAHAPPIPCADQRDPPGFPRPGGSVFGGRGRSLLAARKPAFR